MDYDLRIAGPLRWEVFLPERYKVRDFGGDVLAASPLEAQYVAAEVEVLLRPGQVEHARWVVSNVPSGRMVVAATAPGFRSCGRWWWTKRRG